MHCWLQDGDGYTDRVLCVEDSTPDSSWDVNMIFAMLAPVVQTSPSQVGQAAAGMVG